MILSSLLLGVVLIGCRRAAPEGVVDSTDPDEVLHEQLSRGSFALSTAATTLGETLRAIEDFQAKVPAEGDMRDDVEELIDRLDSCGEAIGDYTTEPPAMPKFRLQVPVQKEQLKSALKAAGEALLGLYEAAGMVESFQDGAPKGLQKALADVADEIDSAIEDIKTAITDMGGTPPTPPGDETDDPEP